MLLAAFALSSVMFVSCNKWEDEINELDSKVAALEQTVASLKAAVDGGAVITGVSNTSEGVKFTLSNGQSYTVNHGAVGATGATGEAGKDGQDGKDGKPGSVVTIGENGNWCIDGVDQGVSAVGASTFVVDRGSYYELNVLEKVDGENAEIVKINLPKTKVITDIVVMSSLSSTSFSYLDNISTKTLNIYYGTILGKNDKIEFNGKTYTNETLVSGDVEFGFAVKPLDADATLYDFELVDTKGNSPFVLSQAKAHTSDAALTKAATANKGFYTIKVSYPNGNFDADDVADRAGIVYALATETAEGLVATQYQLKVNENQVTTAYVGLDYTLDDNKKRTIDLDKCFTDATQVVDHYFEIKDKTAANSKGAVLDGCTLTATKDGVVEVYVNYLLVDGTKGKETISAEFKYIAPTGDALGTINWEVKADDGKANNGVETDYYLPISAIKSALVASSDSQMPAVYISSIKWADGNELNKVTKEVNGAKYGKGGTTINTSDIASVENNTFYTKDSKGNWVTASDINKDLYVKVSFNPNTVLVGEYVVALDFYKSGASNVTVATSVNLNVTAPANAIVKNDPYFNGDNAIVYGTADGANATADLDDLFTTTGLTYKVTKIKQTSSSTKADYFPWGADSSTGAVANGEFTVPVKASNNANYCVGTTQEFTATKTLFTRVEAATYTFTVTVKSPVVVSYTGAAKAINNDPITIDASEFTGKSMKDGSALYIGKVGSNDVDYTNYIQTVSVAADSKDANSKYITVSANAFNTTDEVTYKDSKDNVLYKANGVKVERVAGIALQSAVTCKVNVTVLDKWGVSTVIPVNVTVNPIQ